MKELLKRTHRKEYINILKARDYYFDIARRWNNWSRFFILLTPTVVALSYFPFISSFSFIDDRRDILVGVISIITFIIIHYVCENKKQANFEISNALREKYDCEVFGIPENPFSYQLGDLKPYIEKSRYVNDFYKYEVWYMEIFCDNHARNIIISQLDNITYTYHVYKAYKLFVNIYIAGALVISIVSLAFGIEVFVLVLLSMFNILQNCIESHSNANELIKRNRELIQMVKTEHIKIIDMINRKDYSIIRMLQDVVVSNRNQSLFIPKYIRNKYLEEESVYYRDMNEIKYLYLDEETTAMPSKASDIEIYNLDETATITLDIIQERLLGMMEKIKNVFQKYGITYMMDGGTLIGAVRDRNWRNPTNAVCLKNGGFVFWDDDIDIAIPTTDNMLEKAKEALRKELGDYFDIQDYNSDPYYSPRLSNFRIRDKRSLISEKDSQLHDLYNARGLFIDVYAYTPILYNRVVDTLFRYLFIHPMHYMIKKTEDGYAALRNPQTHEEERQLKKQLSIFKKQKRTYMTVVDWYLKHAKNDKYYVYTPNYIQNLCIPGPYIKKEFLFGELPIAQFESISMPVPTSPADVLNAYYGEWYISPYKSREELQEKYGAIQWFDKPRFVVSVMKHIDHVDFIEDTKDIINYY